MNLKERISDFPLKPVISKGSEPNPNVRYPAHKTLRKTF